MIETKEQAYEPYSQATRNHIKSPAPHDVIKGRNSLLSHFRKGKGVVVRDVLWRFFFAVSKFQSYVFYAELPTRDFIPR
jgi:hypothetical protein